MNTASALTPTILAELAAWCRFSLDLLTAGSPAAVPDAVRDVKRHLASVHRRHLDQLREWLQQDDLRPPEGTGQRAWTEIAAALQAHDERVVRAACALLHRAVTAAYDRAAGRTLHDPELTRQVARQRAELASSFREALMAQPVRPEGTIQPIRQRELSPTLAS